MPAPLPMSSDDRAGNLVADCANCVGLCCVALAFARSADFAFDKPAGDPCVNLEEDSRCRIHPTLRDRGFKGCTVFDCHGAGQKVTGTTFGRKNWREDFDLRGPMFTVFPIVRQLHEMLWYLHTVSARLETRPITAELNGMYVEVEQLTGGSAEEILALNVDGVRNRVNELLSEASTLVRKGAGDAHGPKISKRFHSGADLMGARLSGQDLRGADLRGAWLIGADLREADLRCADLIAADLRDADVSGADLSEAIFLTQMQVNAANGDANTLLPDGVKRPTHWAR